jgi:hypothetical protein
MPRRHHRAPRQPTTATTAATPVEDPHPQLPGGDIAGQAVGFDVVVVSQASATPASAAGSQYRRQRRDRHPTANTSTTAVAT